MRSAQGPEFEFEAMDEVPASFTINAWTGARQPVSGLAPNWWKWAVHRHQVKKDKYLAAPPTANLRDWRNEEVGWGLVLPDNEALSERDRAMGVDVPAELRALLEVRKGAPILRYRPDAVGENLRRYYTNRRAESLALSGSLRGTAPGHLPYYLLIYGSPAQIPWEAQYLLNGPCYTGRIDLKGEALSNYITALVNDWKDGQAKADHPVTWAVDKGPDDITYLMRYLIAEPVHNKLESDPEIRGKTRHFAAGDATVKNLAEALAAPSRTPALIVTTSHGKTGPLDRPDLMLRDLGLPVDANSALVRPEALLSSWQPEGAIWYAHACCSAGSDNTSAYVGLVPTGSAVEQVLLAVAGLGAQVAPLPRALLGAKRPLRAFIGHVEPTFDWTIRNPESEQALTNTIIQALYNHLYQEEREPVGFAFSETFALIGQLFQQWSQAEKASLDADKTIRGHNRIVALRTQLTALDRQACVILGDPTVALPPIGMPEPASGVRSSISG